MVAGCASKPPPAPAAASNEVFGTGPDSIPRAPEGIEDRWASVVLDDQQRAEVVTLLKETVHGPTSILEQAPHGIRFEDVPRAMINAAPTVEMAILSHSFHPAEVTVNFDDHRGRQASASIVLRMRGPRVSVTYRVPGSDTAQAKSRLLIDVFGRLPGSVGHQHEILTPDSAEEILRAAIRSNHGRVESHSWEPDRYRYTMLMLDELEADIEIRREPAPTILSWNATAGLFGRPEVAARLGDALMVALRAWGKDLEPTLVPEGNPATAGPAEG